MSLLFSAPDGRVVWQKTVAGPTSYAAGGFTVTFNELKQIEGVIFIYNDGGYLTEVSNISGNTVTVKVLYFNYPAASAGAAVEVPDATDLSAVNFTIVVVGF